MSFFHRNGMDFLRQHRRAFFRRRQRVKTDRGLEDQCKKMGCAIFLENPVFFRCSMLRAPSFYMEHLGFNVQCMLGISGFEQGDVKVYTISLFKGVCVLNRRRSQQDNSSDAGMLRIRDLQCMISRRFKVPNSNSTKVFASKWSVMTVPPR